MKRYVLALAVLSIFACSGYCQEMPNTAAETAQPESAAVDNVVQPQEISIYGEIKDVNQTAGTVTIQYYDYDSDEEKTIDIVTDVNTKMENAATMSDVKQGNWADVIYSVAGGKNTARSIIIEKDDELPAEMPKVGDAAVSAAPAQQ